MSSADTERADRGPSANELRDLISGDPRVAVDDLEVLFGGEIDHAEGIAIDTDGTIWCGGEDGQIYRIEPNSPCAVVATIGGRPLGIALDASGDAYVAAEAGWTPGGVAAVWKVSPVGGATVLVSEVEGRALVAPNHPAFLPDGTLLCTESGTWGKDDGFVFSVGADGSSSIVDRTCHRYPNGICVSESGDRVLVVESMLPGVSVLERTAAGNFEPSAIVIELPGVIPDGVALDDSGNMLIACFAPDCVLLVDASGTVEAVASDRRRFSLHSPTNVAFVPGTSTVIAANYGERALTRFGHERRGAAVHRPDHSASAWTAM